MTGFLLVVITRELPVVSGTTDKIINPDKTDISFAWPSQGHAVIGTLDGGIKASYGGDNQVPTASMAKVITALVVLDAKSIDDNSVITMTQNDVELLRQTIANNGSNLYVEVGEQLTLRQMLEALMLPSANNISDSLVIWAFGSQENYRSVAKEWLQKNNLHHTSIGADASGLDPGTTSSTSDLFEIARLALRNQTLREIVATESAVFPITGIVQNTNSLLRDGAGYIGVKTGNSIEAGSCLMFASRHLIDGAETTIIGVLAGQEYGNVFNVARTLNQSALNNLTTHKTPAGTVVGSYTVPWDEKINTLTDADLTSLIWRDEDPQIEVSLDDLAVPTYGGQVGTAKIGQSTADVNLLGNIGKPDLWWRLTHIDQLQW